MIVLLLVVVAQAEPSPFYVLLGSAGGLVGLGLAFVLRGFSVLQTQISGLQTHVRTCDHLLGWERIRASYIGREAERAGLHIPLNFYADPGPPGSSYPSLRDPA